MNRTGSKWLLLLSACLLAAGCQDRTDPKGGAGNGGNARSNGTSDGAEPEWKGTLTLEVASWDEIKKEIAAETGEGKVVVVDFWSTWCEPCKEEFPNLVRLQKRYGEKVAAISVSLDYDGIVVESPNEKRDEIKAFLEKHDARFQNFISSTPDEKFYEQAGFSAIPAVFVYDPSGNVTKLTVDTIPSDEPSEEISYEKHVFPRVEKLVQGS